jgi:hypothetical protein
MGGACNAYGDIRNAHKMLVGRSEGKRTREDLSLDGRIMLKWILVVKSMDWIYLSEDRDLWRALVNTLINPRGSVKGEDFLDKQTVPLASEQGLLAP